MRLFRAIIITGFFFVLIFAPSREMARAEERKVKPMEILITVLYNNIPQDTRLTPAWGMSCLIEGMEKTILFDTGGDGRVLLSNMNKLGKDPAQVEIVVLSHVHGDHTGGLSDFLQQAGDVELCFPRSFPDKFKQQAAKTGYKTAAVDKSIKIAEDIYLTGEMGRGIKEQALVLQTAEGLVVITGCAHPGVVNIVKRSKEVCQGEVYLVLGGFHLMELPDREVEAVINALKDLGVKKAGPSHCTGDRAIELFRRAWKKDFMELGLGGTVSLNARAGK